MIVEIWCDVLHLDDVGVDEDFFEAGGHSLLATKVVARIRKVLDAEVSVKDLFEARTVAALATTVAKRSATGVRVVTPRPAEAEPVLSHSQERLWLEHQLLPGSAYNVHARRRLLGLVELDVVLRSIQAVCERHEVLRTRFPVVEGRPVPVVGDSEACRPEVLDLTDAEDREATAARLLDQDAGGVFDLARDVPFRCRIIQLSPTEQLLSVTMHHIVSDQWSMGIFVRELLALYRAGGDPALADLPTLPVQYRDFAHWERGQQSGATLKQGVDHWRTHLAGAPPVIRMPWVASPRGATRGRTQVTLTERDADAMHTLCRARGVTPFMVILAALAVVLRRWSGQPDVVIGVPVAGRSDQGTEGLIGCFVNTLPLRVGLPGNPTFGEVVDQVRTIALSGYAHADTPFDVLVKELRVPRHPWHSPLFQVALNVLDSPVDEQLAGIRVEPLDEPDLPAKFDLVFEVCQTDGLLQIRLEHDAARYHCDLAAALIAQLQTLLALGLAGPAARVLDHALEPSGPDFARRLDAPESATSPAERAVARHAAGGDRVAVIDDRGEWGYSWLNRAADRVRSALTEHGVTAGDPVRLGLDPSAAGLAAILGCQRAGVQLTLVDGDHVDPVTGEPSRGTAVVVHDVPPSGPGESDVVGAVIVDVGQLFTDEADPPCGPNVRPGAETPPVPGDWAVDRFGLDGHDRVAPLSCRPDHLLAALSAATHAGGAVVMSAIADPPDGSAIVERLATLSVSAVFATPPLLRAVAATAASLPSLRYAFVDNHGDLIGRDVDALRRLSSTCTLVGLYRAGADGHIAAAHVVTGTQPVVSSQRLPLGHPATPGSVVVVTSAGRAAVGEVGTVLVGDRPTGDLARRWPDGSLEYVARTDDDGFAADQADIVLALRELPGVDDALLLQRDDDAGDPVRVAYLLGRDPALLRDEVSRRLAPWVPDRLVPDHVVVLDRLPLTGEGHYDLTSLPATGLESGRSDGYRAPRTPIERRLASLLEELLEVDRVGVNDSFFDLGGFSLLATQLLARMGETFQVTVPLPEVFASPTIASLAELIVRAQAEALPQDRLAELLTEIENS